VIWLKLCPRGAPSFRYFPAVFLEKRLGPKNLKGWMKAEELGDLVPELLSLRPSLDALQIESFLEKNW
jgi:hypothetical protein